MNDFQEHGERELKRTYFFAGLPKGSNVKSIVMFLQFYEYTKKSLNLAP